METHHKLFSLLNESNVSSLEGAQALKTLETQVDKILHSISLYKLFVLKVHEGYCKCACLNKYFKSSQSNVWYKTMSPQLVVMLMTMASVN